MNGKRLKSLGRLSDPQGMLFSVELSLAIQDQTFFHLTFHPNAASKQGPWFKDLL